MSGFRAALVPVLLFLVSITSIAAQALAAGTTTRVEVPIYQSQLADGTIRYWVYVRIGDSAPIPAMLDTGSFGLRVLASALSPSDYGDTGIERRFAFGSGVALHGSLATAVVAIGDATTGVPVYFQLVRSVGCVPRKPDCPAARVSPGDFRIGGDGLPGQGFAAILGLSMRRPPVAVAALNPLDFVGDAQWIVMLPLPGTANPGKLIINPSAQDLGGFRSAEMAPPPSGRPGMVRVRACLAGSQLQTDSCPPAKLDSGAGDGLEPYYSFAVLYDMKRGTIAIKPRPDAVVR
jgi:hypothetical protein